jgi:hypothetical protein
MLKANTFNFKFLDPTGRSRSSKQLRDIRRHR